MTRGELIARLSAGHPELAAKQVEVSVKAILEALAESLCEGQRIEIRGFGSFRLTYRPARSAYNPKSGQRLKVRAKFVPRFRAGKELRKQVDSTRDLSPRP